MSTKKVALITGGTSGIGKELAKCFAINGYTIIIVGHDMKRLTATAEEFKKSYGAEVQTIEVDLTEVGSAEKVYAALQGRTVDVLVNAAGYAINGLFHETDTEDILKLLRINTESLTHLTRLVLPNMIDRRSGRILNIAATAAFQPGPLMTVYYASKAYVLSFSEALHYELKGTGVSVTTLCPGPTDTPFPRKANISSTRLYRKMMKPDDVARLAYHDLIDGRALSIPGFRNKIGMFMTRLAPRSLALRVVNRLNKVHERKA